MNKNDICKEFLLNPTINPISNRKIEINGPTFKKLTKLCYELEYNDEIEDLLDSLISDEKVGLTGERDIEQMIILSYDLETIIKLLKTDSRLRSLVYELIPNIIENYRNNQHRDDIIQFLFNLIEMKEFSLLDRVVVELEKNTDLITNYNLDGILEFMTMADWNKRLDSLLFDLIPEIVQINIDNFVPTEKYWSREQPFNKFIKGLLSMKREEFAKTTMEEFVKIMDDYDNYHTILQDIFEYDNQFAPQVVEGYFKILPIDYDVDYLSIEQIIQSHFLYLNDDKIQLYLTDIIIAAINLKNNILLDTVDNILQEVLQDERQDNFDLRTLYKISDLIDEAKSILNK